MTSMHALQDCVYPGQACATDPDCCSQMPLPDAVPDDAAAQAYINPVTAYQLIEELHLPADSWLLQSAASSAVGKLLVQIARHKGIKTINVVRNMDSEQELRKLGSF